MAAADAPRQVPRHLAPRPTEAGAFGPPLDPQLYLSEEGVLPTAPSPTPSPASPAPAGTPWSDEHWTDSPEADADATHGGDGGNGDGGNGDGHGEHDPLAPATDGGDPESRSRSDLVPLLVDIGIVAACCLFVFLQLGPSNLFSDTTPAGGDMGAHVWGPAYLRDHLLPNFQVAGWAPDWYAGFPAYQFYMVVPSMMIVLLDVGFEGPFAVLPLAAAIACAVFAARSWRDASPRRRNLFTGGAVLALGCIGMPYGVAFKLISVSGAVTLPIAAYAFGRLSGLKFPTPALFSVASLVFLFYRGFTIYGGNLPSTLAGEFAFSISLSLGLLYLGVLFRGFETGKHRGLAAVLLALTGLCHLIPAFWVIGATLIALIVRPRRTTETTTRLCAILAGAGTALCLMAVHWQIGGDDKVLWNGHLELPLPLGSRELPIPVWVGGAMLIAAAVLWLLPSQTARWVLPSLVVGGMLSAWWVLPFQRRGTYVNDMGWEKIPIPGQNPPQSWSRYLLPPDLSDPPGSDLRWVFALALVGVGLSLAARMRVGIFLTGCSVALGVAFWLLPDGRLWNARLLPFYYLTVMLLAALAFTEGARIIAEVFRGRDTGPLRSHASSVVTAVSGFVGVLVVVGLPLGVLPFKENITNEAGGQGYAWPSFSPLQLESTPGSYIKGWANWNYEGYEGKPAYREYYEITQTMERLGERPGGCGRAMWEYEKELDRYGTPMALMLLPYWTDGCIGSMEGLYFEASSTTPFHFLMQTELSEAPSSAQRDMPYSGFDINKGVQHMRLLGVRYYMATSDLAVQAASAHPDLTQVAESGPWAVFEVANSAVVQPLINEPQVVADANGTQDEWLEHPTDISGRADGPAVRWFMNPELWDVALAAGGPDEWERIEVADLVTGQRPTGEAIEPAQVSNIEIGRDKIEFDVDRVGSPVLVKASYFPNWKASGADGPWRVAPNLMVVVPTERHVELNYGRTSIEWSAYLVTLMGLVGLVLLARRGTYRFERALPVPPVQPLVPPPPEP